MSDKYQGENGAEKYNLNIQNKNYSCVFGHELNSLYANEQELKKGK